MEKSLRKWCQNCNLTVFSPSEPLRDPREIVGARELAELAASLQLSLGLAVGTETEPRLGAGALLSSSDVSSLLPREPVSPFIC